jgi:hypothetical protein
MGSNSDNQTNVFSSEHLTNEFLLQFVDEPFTITPQNEEIFRKQVIEFIKEEIKEDKDFAKIIFEHIVHQIFLKNIVRK